MKVNDITYDMLTNGETHRDRLRALADAVTEEQANEVLCMLADRIYIPPLDEWVNAVVSAYRDIPQVKEITVRTIDFDHAFEFWATIYFDGFETRGELMDWLASMNWLNERELPIRFGYYYCIYMPEIFDLHDISVRSDDRVVYMRDEKGDTER